MAQNMIMEFNLDEDNLQDAAEFGFELITQAPDTAKLPSRATSGSAGYDISSTIEVTIEPKTVVAIATGVKASMPKDEVLMLYPRSSVGIKRNLMLANTVGVIDSDYYNNKDNEGEIIVALYNYGNEPQKIEAGERIAQGVFTKISIEKKPQLETEIDRSGGIGSTGN